MITKVNPKTIYKYIYKKIHDLTPLNADCGELCNKACCSGDDDTGMYLFPFEQEIYKNKSNIKSWLKIESSDFICNEKAVKIAICNEKCDRKLRPLSCRIFPLTPYISTDGTFSVVIDKRASGICPIAYATNLESLNNDFVKNVTKCMKLLMKIKSTRNYIFQLSRIIDECN